MKTPLGSLLVLAFALCAVGHVAAQPQLTREELTGSYFRQFTTFSWRLNLHLNGDYSFENQACLGTTVIPGTWRLRKGQVVLTPNNTQPTAFRKDAFRRFQALAEGANWVLVLNEAMSGRFGPSINFALRREPPTPADSSGGGQLAQ